MEVAGTSLCRWGYHFRETETFINPVNPSAKVGGRSSLDASRVFQSWSRADLSTICNEIMQAHLVPRSRSLHRIARRTDEIIADHITPASLNLYRTMDPLPGLSRCIHTVMGIEEER